jgi:hypothetical protein
VKQIGIFFVNATDGTDSWCFCTLNFKFTLLCDRNRQVFHERENLDVLCSEVIELKCRILDDDCSPCMGVGRRCFMPESGLNQKPMKWNWIQFSLEMHVWNIFDHYSHLKRRRMGDTQHSLVCSSCEISEGKYSNDCLSKGEKNVPWLELGRDSPVYCASWHLAQPSEKFFLFHFAQNGSHSKEIPDIVTLLDK